MPKWISVLCSHCIKWTRVLMPLPVQRPRGMLCWWKHRFCLCAEGWAFPERIRVRSSSWACVRWHSSWTLDQSECVRVVWPCQALPTTCSSTAASRCPAGCQGCGRAVQSPGAALGCRGEWAQPGPGCSRHSSVIALFFLTDCAGIPGLGGRVCCG